VRLRIAADSVPGERYKSERKAERLGLGARHVPAGVKRRGFQTGLRVAVSLLAQELAGFLVDEMKPGAGEADDGRIGIGTGLVRRGLRKPMLYVRAQPRTFEKDMSAHSREYAKLMRRVTSVCLRSWGPWRARKGPQLLRPGPLGMEDAAQPGGFCLGFCNFQERKMA